MQYFFTITNCRKEIVHKKQKRSVDGSKICMISFFSVLFLIEPGNPYEEI